MGGRVEFNVIPDDVLNKFLKQYRVASQSLRYSHAAIRLVPLDALPMLEVDGLAFNVEDPQMRSDPASHINETDGWLLRAAFIDLIAGLNESLMEGCRILRIYRRSKETMEKPLTSKEEAELLMDRIDDELMRKHIPELMDELQRAIGEKLPLFDSIASINKLRNCLVHRNGIVEGRDVNIPDDEMLRLRFLQHQIHVRINGVEHRLTRALKAQRPIVSAMKIEHWDTYIDFPLGSPIELSTDLFNDSFFTCYAFLHNLRLQVYKAINVIPAIDVPEVVLVRADKSHDQYPTE